MPTDQQRDQYNAYMRGWAAGVTLAVSDSSTTRHPDRSISAAYNAGYQDGILVRRGAIRYAALTYGFEQRSTILQSGHNSSLRLLVGQSTERGSARR